MQSMISARIFGLCLYYLHEVQVGYDQSCHEPKIAYEWITLESRIQGREDRPRPMKFLGSREMSWIDVVTILWSNLYVLNFRRLPQVSKRMRERKQVQARGASLLEDHSMVYDKRLEQRELWLPGAIAWLQSALIIMTEIRKAEG